VTSDEKEIRDLIETWMKASKAGDTATVLGLMSADVVFLLPLRNRCAAARNSKLAQVGIRNFDIDGHSDVQEIHVNGDWAYRWNFLTVTFTSKNDGPSGKRAGNVLTVLRRENGRWVIFRDANLLTKVDG
jgi:uncharacterized protein (TIGR02246 family)